MAKNVYPVGWNMILIEQIELEDKPEGHSWREPTRHEPPFDSRYEKEHRDKLGVEVTILSSISVINWSN